MLCDQYIIKRMLKSISYSWISIDCMVKCSFVQQYGIGKTQHKASSGVNLLHTKACLDL